LALFWRADFFCLKKARAMTGLIPTTPFGRRPVTLGQIAAGQWTRRVVEEAAKPGSNHPAAVNKWQLFRTLTEVRERLGVSDRSLSVLNALLSFHPETALTLPRRADACEAGGGEAAKRTHRPGAKADPARAKQDIRRRPGDRSGGEHFGERVIGDEAPNAEAPGHKTSGAGTPGADPDIGCDLVVFPSNKALSQRAHGMAGTTLWRHLTALVAAGLIQRRDSPNGKRYARKGEGGEDRFSDAFGFDLTPLVARAPEFEALAEAARIERRQRYLRKERISLLRRDVGKLIGLGLDEGLAGDWEGLRLRAMTLMRPLRSLRDDDDLAGLEAELAALREEAAKALEIHVNSSNMQCNDHHNGMHQSNSNTQCHEDLEPASKEEGPPGAGVTQDAATEPAGTAASPDAGPSYPLGLILEACPDIRDYGPGGRIRGWSDFVNAAALVRPMIGISPDAWREAQEALGPQAAPVAIAAILQRSIHSSEATTMAGTTPDAAAGAVLVNGSPAIRSAGGYLRALSAKARAGELALGPLLMALIGQRLKARKAHAAGSPS
jgi:replication initiation protein RepC